MAPQPSELGEDSIPTLRDIIRPTGELIPHLERWVQTAGQKLNGTSSLQGFILDGDCVHPVVEVGTTGKRGLFALGGEQCVDLFLVTQITSAKEGTSFAVAWGGQTKEKTYRVTTDGFLPIENHQLGLLRGDRTGKIPTTGIVLFREQAANKPLNEKLESLFPFSDNKKECVFALWRGLQKAAGILKT